MTLPLTIDAEFQALIPPLSDDERAQLEASLKAEGCRDALVAWKQNDTLTLVDGHNRYELCKRHGVEYKVIEREFESREDVIVWMATNQLARRNLTAFARGELALRMKAAFAAKAQHREVSGKRVDPSQNFGKGRTDSEVGKIAELSHETIRKVEAVAKSAPDPIKKKARDGDLSVDRAFKLTRELQTASAPVVEAVVKQNLDDVETVKVLKALRPDSDTLQEIAATGVIQLGDERETVSIHDGALKVRAAIEQKSEIHKQLARDAKRAERDGAATTAELSLVPAPKPVYKRGDVVRLGQHVLICGDNTDETVKTIIQAEGRAALAFADPPYNANVASWDTGAFTWKQDYLADAADIVAVTPGISSIWDFMRKTEMPYRWSVSAHISNGMTRGALGFGNWIYTAIFSKQDTLHRNAQDVTTITINALDAHDLGAKRQKPPRYLAWLFQLLTKRDDLIIDAFGGSGVGVIVAHELGRRCVSVELDEETFNQMVDRVAATLKLEVKKAA